MLHSYPKVWNLGHPEVATLFEGEVFAQEKIDGSQFSFGAIDGALQMRSKGADVYDDTKGGRFGAQNMFDAAVAAVLELRDALTPGWTYRGEYLQKPKHNTLAYDRAPARHIILFDVETAPHTFLRPDALRAEGERIGLEVVPQFTWQPGDNPLAAMTALLDTVSVLGGQKVEGVVFKNYDRFGKDGKVLMGKHVSEHFKEVHRGSWRDANPSQGDIVDVLANSLRTPARWDKAVQHLRERGALTDSPRDIGPLLKELRSDVEAEEAERVKEALFQWAWPKIVRGIGAGFPEYYKDRLLARQFT